MTLLRAAGKFPFRLLKLSFLVGFYQDKLGTAIGRQRVTAKSFRAFLFYTGITDLDADGDYDSEGEVESYRYAGLVLQVNIYYSNDVHAFSGRSYQCALPFNPTSS